MGWLNSQQTDAVNMW